MKIYVASLADYNNGVLHGVWIDVENTTMEAVQEQINAMLADSPTEPGTAEEWGIHDTEDIPRGVCAAGLETIFEFAALATKVAYRDAFNAWVDDGHVEDMEEYADHFVGRFYSTREFVETWLSESGILAGVPEIIAGNLDIDGIWEDFRAGGDYYAIKANGSGIYIYKG